MIENILIWAGAILFTEAVVEILVASDLWIGLRAYFSKRFPRSLGKLFTCGYCMSVWVAALTGWALPGSLIGIEPVDIVIKIFCLHRLSNILHELFVRWFKRLPLVIVFNQVRQDDIYENDEIEVSDVETAPDDAGDRRTEVEG